MNATFNPLLRSRLPPPAHFDRIFTEQAISMIDFNALGLPPLQELQKGQPLPINTCAMSIKTFYDCVAALTTRESLVQQVKALHKQIEELSRESPTQETATAACSSQTSALRRKYVKAQTLEDFIACDPTILNGQPISEHLKKFMQMEDKHGRGYVALTVTQIVDFIATQLAVHQLSSENALLASGLCAKKKPSVPKPTKDSDEISALREELRKSLAEVDQLEKKHKRDIQVHKKEAQTKETALDLRIQDLMKKLEERDLAAKELAKKHDVSIQNLTTQLSEKDKRIAELKSLVDQHRNTCAVGPFGAVKMGSTI